MLPHGILIEMRLLLITLLPALALAQTPPAPANAAAPKPATTQAKPAATAAPGSLATDDEKTVYAIGLAISRQIAMFNLTPSEVDILRRGISDGAAGKPEIELNTWGPKIQPLMTARMAVVAEKEKAASATYLAKAAAEPGAVKTDSGLVYRDRKSVV